MISICRTAFTLMEVLLAVAIVVVLMGGMFALYWRGLEVRDRTTEILDEVTAQRLLLDRITDELRTAMVYPFLQFGLIGEANQAEWFTCRLPGPAAWVPADITDDPRAPESDIQVVGYRLRYAEDENGDSFVAGLERTVQRVLAPETVEESNADAEGDDAENAAAEDEDSAAVQVEFVTDHVKLIRFQYYDGEGWSESWTDSDLPIAVEVIVGRDPLAEDEDLEDYAAPLMRRIIYVPGRGVRQSRTEEETGEGGEI